MMETNRRSHERNAVDLPLFYRMPASDHYAITRLFNVSAGGGYFETGRHMPSDHPLEVLAFPATRETQASGVHVECQARVRWCRGLAAEHPKRFGIGVQFLAAAPSPLQVHLPDCTWTCDLCSRNGQVEILCRTKEGVCLCPSCFDHLDRMPEGTVKQSVFRFLSGNIV